MDKSARTGSCVVPRQSTDSRRPVRRLRIRGGRSLRLPCAHHHPVPALRQMRVDRGAVRIGSDGLAEVFERVDGGDAAGLACGALGGLCRKREHGAAPQVGRARVPAGYASTRSSALSVPSRPKYSPSGRTTMVAAKRSPPTWRATDEQGPDVAVRCAPASVTASGRTPEFGFGHCGGLPRTTHRDGERQERFILSHTRSSAEHPARQILTNASTSLAGGATRPGVGPQVRALPRSEWGRGMRVDAPLRLWTMR